jgi:antitoxin CptB
MADMDGLDVYISAGSDGPERARRRFAILAGGRMTEQHGPGEELRRRRNRLRFRAWHRGLREVDLLLGRFVDAHVAEMNMNDIKSFEDILEVPDGLVLAWVTGEMDLPEENDTPMFRRILRFHGRGTD